MRDGAFKAVSGRPSQAHEARCPGVLVQAPGLSFALGSVAGVGMTRKTLLVVGAGLLGLVVGCASAHVAARDYQTGVFTVCGNKHADMNTLNEEAAKVCVGSSVPADPPMRGTGLREHRVCHGEPIRRFCGQQASRRQLLRLPLPAHGRAATATQLTAAARGSRPGPLLLPTAARSGCTQPPERGSGRERMPQVLPRPPSSGVSANSAPLAPGRPHRRLARSRSRSRLGRRVSAS